MKSETYFWIIAQQEKRESRRKEDLKREAERIVLPLGFSAAFLGLSTTETPSSKTLNGQSRFSVGEMPLEPE
jgi:hypothetical protein